MTDTPTEGATGVAEQTEGASGATGPTEGATGATAVAEGASGASGSTEGATGVEGASGASAEASKTPPTDDPNADPLAAINTPPEEEFAEPEPAHKKPPHPALRGVAGGPQASNSGEHVAHGHKLPHTA